MTGAGTRAVRWSWRELATRTRRPVRWVRVYLVGLSGRARRPVRCDKMR